MTDEELLGQNPYVPTRFMSTNATNSPNDSGHTICRDCTECIDCGLCKCGKSVLNFKHIEHAIQTMGSYSRLFKVIKKEIQQRGYWKNKSRGKNI